MNPKLDSFAGNGKALAPELFQGQRKKKKTKQNWKSKCGPKFKDFCLTSNLIAALAAVIVAFSNILKILPPSGRLLELLREFTTFCILQSDLSHLFLSFSSSQS